MEPPGLVAVIQINVTDHKTMIIMNINAQASPFLPRLLGFRIGFAGSEVEFTG